MSKKKYVCECGFKTDNSKIFGGHCSKCKKHIRNDILEIRHCKFCNSEFTCKKSSTKQYCNKSCANKNRATTYNSKKKKLSEKISKKSILHIIKEDIYCPYTEIAKKLNISYKDLLYLIDYYNINYKGNSSLKNKHKSKKSNQSFNDYINNSSNPQTGKVKKQLFIEGLKEYKCERCGISQWLGENIVLELHHKDGNKKNNNIENLEILCPNCHSQTDTFRGKNTSKHKANLKNNSINLKEQYEEQLKKKIQKEIDKEEKKEKDKEKYNEYKESDQIDKLGRATDSKNSKEEWQRRLNIILDTKIDLTKYGWMSKLQKLNISLTGQQIMRTLNYFNIDYYKLPNAKISDQENEEYLKSGPHYCEKCGKLIEKKFGSGRFCSKACANSRTHTEEQKQKIRDSIKKYNYNKK